MTYGAHKIHMVGSQVEKKNEEKHGKREGGEAARMLKKRRIKSEAIIVGTNGLGNRNQLIDADVSDAYKID